MPQRRPHPGTPAGARGATRGPCRPPERGVHGGPSPGRPRATGELTQARDQAEAPPRRTALRKILPARRVDFALAAGRRGRGGGVTGESERAAPARGGPALGPRGEEITPMSMLPNRGRDIN